MLVHAMTMLLLMGMATDDQKSTLRLPQKFQSAKVGQAKSWNIGKEGPQLRVWGGELKSGNIYFDEFLPAVFKRTLVFQNLESDDTPFNWIFTGDRAGFTLNFTKNEVTVRQRFYDSFALNELKDGEIQYGVYPEKKWLHNTIVYSGPLQEVSVVLNHRLQLLVYLNGVKAFQQSCLFDVSRHQLEFNSDKQTIAGRLIKPPVKETVVRLQTQKRHQTMIGFGGITTPTAYAQLSPAGKQQWWKIICEYNLKIQREYPIGTQLNRKMNNWDNLNDATPHYYGDNFPNGEISDFNYIRTLRKLGGMVWFEFWGLPPWAVQEYEDENGKVWKEAADPELYSEAMLSYCKTSEEKAGAPPDIVGIQNEITQPTAIWHQMTGLLREKLDAAGFEQVQIHMSDSPFAGLASEWITQYKKDPQVWQIIDYAAAHMYDYQNYLSKPDQFDSLLHRLHETAGDKPFLSTEISLNYPQFQHPSFREALGMGQLYHKNLVLADASAICYCWTLINVTQPSFGWTRTLFVVDREHGFVPASHNLQLRVYGAYSRRIVKGMKRITIEDDDKHLLASAFVGDKGRLTLVLLNRGISTRRVHIPNVKNKFEIMEIAGPYSPNQLQEVPDADKNGALNLSVHPGTIVTLSNVPLGELPDNFELN
jgi:O-glycosyl hydrolase